MTGALSTLVLLLAAMALGLATSKRFRVLSIPLTLGMGYAVGEGGLGLVANDALLGGASEIGLILMLFYTSLFSNPRALREAGITGLPLAAFDLVLNFMVAWWVGAYAGLDPTQRIFLAGIMASSSTAVIMKVLGDEGRISHREGNVLISLLMIEDWAFIGVFAYLGLRYGANGPLRLEVIALGLLAFLAFLVACRLLRSYVWRIQQREVLVPVLTGLGLLGALIGNLGGLPVVGSAFTTGLILAGPRAARFAQKEAPFLRDAASALFFAGYGATLGPHLQAGLWKLLGLSLAGILVTEMLFMPVLARRLGLRRHEAFILGSALVARGGKSAAFARSSEGATGPSPLYALAGLLALVLTPLAPLLIKLGLYVSRDARRVPHGGAGEGFSRAARSLLMPHTYRQRAGTPMWDRIVFGQGLILAVQFAILAVVVPWPWRVAPAVLAAVSIVPLFLWLRVRVRRHPGGARMALSTRSAGVPDHALERLPFLLAAPLLLLLAAAVASPWTLAAYPALLTALFFVALTLPYWRPMRRRAPSLPRALGVAVDRSAPSTRAGAP